MTTVSGTELDGKSAAAPGERQGQVSGDGDIVARPGRYYRNARYLMTLICVGSGLWFAYDGWVGWPNENLKYAEVSAKLDTARATGDKDAASKYQEELKSLTQHTGYDIPIQRILGFSLPPLGVGLLAWAFYRSRGTYRFAGDTLYVPGHPPVPVDAIRKIDKAKWDRKGIAYIEYEIPGAPGGTARLKLDDFIYEQAPTKAILARIESLVLPESAPAEAAEAADAAEAETQPTSQHE